MKKKLQRQYVPRRAEVDKRSGEHTSRFAPDWWELEGKHLKKIRVCKNCHAIYYDGHWHTWSRVKDLAERLRKAGVAEAICAECRRTRDVGLEGKRNYEGEVILSGWRDTTEKSEILATVRNVGKRAALRDPEDQIIRIEDQGKKVRIITTENQLAVSIGKQVDRARKGGKLEIRWSEGDALVRVRWNGSKFR